MAFSEEQLSALDKINLIGGIASFLGASLIIFCYFYFVSLRSVAFRLVFFLSISDLIYSMTGFGSPAAGTAGCYVQGFTTQLFSLSSVFWTCAIAFTLHLTVLRAVPPRIIASYFPRFHIFCWGIPLLLTLLPFSTNSYGYSNGWCWFVDGPWGIFWRLTFYIPLWLAIIYLCYVYYHLYRILSQAGTAGVVTSSDAVLKSDQAIAQSPEEIQVVKARENVVNRIKYYPLVLICCYFFATINRLYNLSGLTSFGLTVLHFTGIRIRGFVNSLVYGLNPTIQSAIHKTLCRSQQRGGMEAVSPEPHSAQVEITQIDSVPRDSVPRDSVS